MSTSEAEHIHRLKRHKYKNGTAVYFCNLNCHFKVEVPFAVGKVVLCNICNEPFTMTEYSIKLARPHCTGCGKIQVKDANGRQKLVPKDKLNPIAAAVANSATEALKQRLGGIVLPMEKPPDEDI